MIDEARRQEILAELDRVERERGVRTLLAIESGSRAWGFPSADSDYDVRIIYAHPQDWYLSVLDRRDVIEQPISGDLDIAGWDLRKALRLMMGGNAVLHEWLGSPIVYRQDDEAVAQLQQQARDYFDPRTAFHHYFAMSAKKLDVQEGELLTAKRFLYGMRTLLCARWVQELETAPPMLFSELLARYVPAGSAEREAIGHLIRLKAEGSEKDLDAGLGSLLAYAAEGIAALRQVQAPAQRPVAPGALDVVFRQLLR